MTVHYLSFNPTFQHLQDKKSMEAPGYLMALQSQQGADLGAKRPFLKRSKCKRDREVQ